MDDDFDRTRIGRPKVAGPQLRAVARVTIKASPTERQAGSSFELRGVEVMIGRASDNVIVLNDEDVSRHHARIVRRDNADWIIDTDSANGTWINGERVTERPLRKGDTLLIGSTVLSYEPL